MAGTQPVRPGPARGAPRDPWGHPSGQHPACLARGSLASETALQLSPTDRLPSFFPLVYFSSYRAYYQAFCTVNAVSGLKPIEPAPTQAQPGTPCKLRACQLQPQARAQATHGTGSRLLLALRLPLLPGDVPPCRWGCERMQPAAPLAVSSPCSTSCSRACGQGQPDRKDSQEHAALGSCLHHAAHTHPSSMSIGVPSGSRSSADTN